LPNWNAAVSPAAEEPPVSVMAAATAVSRCANVLSAILKVAIPAADIDAVPAAIVPPAVTTKVAVA
ncbi:MAG: hypothetical protein ACK56I_06775, partial [bacterium]